MKQQELFTLDSEKALQLRDHGIRVAVENAESQIPHWNDLADAALRSFLKTVSGPFMAEDLRTWAKSVPMPPSKRAWGGVMLRASKLGLIARAGYQETKNPLAHRTPATLWRRA